MSYATLQSRFLSWVKRTDITAQFPEFVALAEARFNREIRVKQMYQSLTATIDVNNEVATPAGFLAIKSLWPSGFPLSFLTEQTLETVTASPRYSYPTQFAVLNAALRFNGPGDVQGVYYTSIPSLQAATTNWLDTMAPDLYLAAVLAEAYVYLEDPKASAWTGQRDLLIQEVNSNDMRDRFSGPLQSIKR